MLINRVASQLLSAPELRDFMRDIREGKDTSIAL